MTITIGTFSTNALIAQPFGYEGDARTGLTARTFTINGLLTSAEWQALISEYNSWRNTRITDADTLSSGTVGTTVSLTITPANGLSVSSLACWFIEAPTGEQAGPFINASVTLADAAQALAVLLREQEKSRQNTEATLPSLGTVTFTRVAGTSPVVTLTQPMLTRQDGPQVALRPLASAMSPVRSRPTRSARSRATSAPAPLMICWPGTTRRSRQCRPRRVGSRSLRQRPPLR
jgi:hypothetical protein